MASGCYRAVGRIYDSYRFEFCLKRRGTYTVTGGGLRCEGRLRWELSGPGVDVDLRRTSCGRGKAWSADSMWCRPNLLIGFLAAIAKARQPLLAALNCDYRPARGHRRKADQLRRAAALVAAGRGLLWRILVWTVGIVVVLAVVALLAFRFSPSTGCCGRDSGQRRSSSAKPPAMKASTPVGFRWSVS